MAILKTKKIKIASLIVIIFIAILSLSFWSIIRENKSDKSDDLFKAVIVSEDLNLTVSDSITIQYSIGAEVCENVKIKPDDSDLKNYEKIYQDLFKNAAVQFITSNPNIITISNNIITGREAGETDVEIILTQEYHKQPRDKKYRNIMMVSKKIKVTVQEKNSY